MMNLDWAAAREELAVWRADEYDLIWYSHVDAWWPMHDLLDGIPAIVDLDNLENLALRLRRRIPPRFPPEVGPVGRLKVLGRWATSRAFDLVDERRWDRAQKQCASQVDRVVVCSELDVQRSECPNAVVVPNGCAEPDSVTEDRRPVRGAAPTLLFVGALDYEPNSEAVEWFVRDVWPLIREDRPDAVVRVVGRGDEGVSWVSGEAGVELVGPVPDLAVELNGADMSIVPIRVGAGTRLKVVEALANRLPLVTTTVGCEGIPVVDGVSALIADDERGFADACVRLLDDGDLRQSLADAGGELFRSAFTWDRIGERVAVLADEVAGSEARSTLDPES